MLGQWNTLPLTVKQTVSEQNSSRSVTYYGKSYDVTFLFGAVSRELPVETETIQTQLHQSTNEEHYTYTNVPWRLCLRKEVFANTNTETYKALIKIYLLYSTVFFLFFSTGFLSQRQLQQSSGAGAHFQAGHLIESWTDVGLINIHTTIFNESVHLYTLLLSFSIFDKRKAIGGSN